jgi:hypothetical protein
VNESGVVSGIEIAGDRVAGNSNTSNASIAACAEGEGPTGITLASVGDIRRFRKVTLPQPLHWTALRPAFRKRYPHISGAYRKLDIGGPLRAIPFQKSSLPQAWLCAILWPMKASGMVAILVGLTALCGCVANHGGPAVVRTTVRIETVRHGDSQIQAGLSKDVIYIDTPAYCAPNTECALFVADVEEKNATLVKAHLGQVVGNYVEVRRGLKPGDHVIVSDMSLWTRYPRVDLY